ncbi:SNF2 family N-terminal domain-containing protein, partial [Nemania abortiva]
MGVSGINAHHGVLSGLSESQSIQPLSQSPATPQSTEAMDVDIQDDTCFGVVIATPTYARAQETGAYYAPVNLKPFGDSLIFYDQSSGKYAGSLVNGRLIDAFRRLPLRLDATLFILEAKGTRKGNKNQTKKCGPEEMVRESSIRIVLHGCQDDKKTISDLISDAGFSLQNPSATEVIPGARYDNPNYHIRRGGKIPEPRDLRLGAINERSNPNEAADEISLCRFLGILENADASGEIKKMVNASPSPRLCSRLMRHQIIALAMMQEKESGFIEEPIFPSLWEKEPAENGRVTYRNTVTRSLETNPILAMGGILADDMGLGKTLSMLALICSSLDFEDTIMDENKGTQHRGTLIVAPKSTIYSWETQVSEHIHPEQIRMETYHGPGRESVAARFQEFDIIITTYDTLRAEWATSDGAGPLLAWRWLRVVLDEAHHIRNRSSQNFQSTCALKSRYRWCLTGTPIHNGLDDYGALLSFVGVFPFEKRPNFVKWIVKPVEVMDKLGVNRLRRLIQTTCLRRTKQKILSSGELQLPHRSEKTQDVHLHPEDQILYDSVKESCARVATDLDKRAREYTTTKDKEDNILPFILYLRLICDHGEQLLSDKIKKRIKDGLVSPSNWGTPELCFACGGEISDRISEKRGKDSILCTHCATPEESLGDSTSTNVGADLPDRKDILFPRSGGLETPGSAESAYRPSAKVIALLENLSQEQEIPKGCNGRPRKSVVFSFWVKMLDLIEQAFNERQISFQRIDGSTDLARRRKAMQEFNDNPDCMVMLASIGSSAEGLNLTAAGVVHLMEPHWSPMMEAQAIDRVYRVGQTQEVKVIRYIVPDSMEVHVQQVQQKKIQIINTGTIDMSDASRIAMESERWEKMKKML